MSEIDGCFVGVGLGLRFDILGFGKDVAAAAMVAVAATAMICTDGRKMDCGYDVKQ